MTRAIDDKNAAPNAASAQTADPRATAVDYKVSFDKTIAARAGLAAEDVVDVNLDVPQAVTIANSALKRIASVRAQMTGLPVDLDAIDKVGVYAEALAYVHAVYSVEAAPPEGMQESYDRLIQIRSLLRLDASNLAARGLILEASIAALKGDIGFQNVAYDVFSLVSMHEAASAKSAGRTAVTVAELAEARAEASKFLNLVAQREEQLKARSELNEERRRAFTLLFQAYDEARRVVTFLLWKEPAKYLPSLYLTRGSGRPKASTVPNTDLPGASTTGAAAVGASNSSGATGAPVTTIAPAGPAAPTGPVGSRGGSPFAGG